MNKPAGLNTWIRAARLRTLPLAFSSILYGGFLASKYEAFRWEILVFSLLTTLFLQILSNWANDLGDSLHGADHAQRQGPSRAVQSGALTPGQMKKAVIGMALAAFFSGLILLYLAFGTDWNLYGKFLILGLGAIAAAILYTNGKRPYGYVGLGDLFVLIFFGWVGVAGSLFLYTHTLEMTAILAGTAVGLLAVGVLNVNNMRDIESDKLAGKNSIPVRLGLKGAKIYHSILLLSALWWNAVALFLACYGVSVYWVVLLVPYGLIVGQGVRVIKAQTPSELDKLLKPLALGTLALVLVSGGLILQSL